MLVDDEQLAREELGYLLGQVGGIEIIGQADNGAEARRDHRTAAAGPGVPRRADARPHWVRGGAAPASTARPVAQIVFVTAYDQRAIEAFEVNAVDYLLKPVDPTRLEMAVQRARRRIASERQNGQRTDPAAARRRDQLEKNRSTGQRTPEPPRAAGGQGRRTLHAGAGGGNHPRSLADETITIVTGQYAGTSNYRTLDELQARLDPERVLAGASIAPGEHQQDQGDRPVVQSELHPENEGREGDGDSGQPDADETSQGISEDLSAASEPMPRCGPSATSRGRSSRDGIHRVRDRRRRSIGPGSASGASRGRRAQATPALPAASRVAQVQEEFVAWIKTLFSAAVYAILIVTFGFQVARVEGQSMAHTLEDQDRLIVNKLVYRISEPRRGDIVMLYYPLNPDKSFVKRVIAEEGDSVRIVDGRVYVNDIPLQDDYVSAEFRSHDDWGPQIIPGGLLLRDGRSSEQQLRQPALGHGAQEVHHRQGAVALVAGADCSCLLSATPDVARGPRRACWS